MEEERRKHSVEAAILVRQVGRHPFIELQLYSGRRRLSSRLGEHLGIRVQPGQLDLRFGQLRLDGERTGAACKVKHPVPP
jgi:hypothetical protein